MVSTRELGHGDLAEAAQILGRAMCDNPINLCAFGIADAVRRRQALTQFFAPVLRGLYRRGSICGAFYGSSMVGVCGVARPGLCQPAPLEKLSVIPAILPRNSLSAALRINTWTSEWARRDPVEPHWHLGPVAVDPDMQGEGIGSAMLAAFCSHMDTYVSFSYLETDRSENVRFYQKFGFAVSAKASVLGVPTWFMFRPGTSKNPVA